MPRGVREMIGAQLSRLSDPCNEVLAMASVVGRTFSAAMIEQVLAMSGDAVMAAIGEAVDVHLVRAEPDTPGRFGFVHSLTRDTIYEDLGPARRPSLHRRVGETLEAMAAGDVCPYLPALAHHFYEAVAEGQSAKALDYAVGAGRQADQRLAFEEAAAYYEQALRVADVVGGDPTGRCRMLVELGDVQFRAGAADEARKVFLDAIDTARRLGNVELLAQATLGYGGRFVGQRPGLVDDVLVGLLNDALAAVGPADSVERARLLARLSRALYYSQADDRPRSLSQEALEMATRLGDSAARIAALNSRYWVLGCPEESDQRIATVTEMLEVASAAGDKEMTLQAHHWLLIELAERGRMAAVDDEIAAYTRLAEEIRQPLYRWYAMEFGVMRALMSGHFDEGEALACQAADAWEEALAGFNIRQLLTVQLVNLRIEQGRDDEARDLLKAHPVDGDDAATRAVRALMACNLGETNEDARKELRSLCAEDLDARPHDVAWMGKVTALAQLCVHLDDVDEAARLYELLLPYRSQTVVIAGGVACRGPVAHYLGLLAALVGRLDDAVAHFEEALESNAAMGARPLLAQTQFELARVMVENGPRVRNQNALGLLGEAIATAEALGMMSLMRRAMKLRHRARRTKPAPVAPGATRRSAPKGVNLFSAHDGYWSVEFEGNGFSVRNTLGMGYLHQLLQLPGRDVHVNHLLAPRTPDGGNSGDAPTGPGPGPDSAERARKAVTNRINAAIRRIEAEDPNLANHLTEGIRTGRFCSYRPAEPTRWSL